MPTSRLQLERGLCEGMWARVPALTTGATRVVHRAEERSQYREKARNDSSSSSATLLGRENDQSHQLLLDFKEAMLQPRFHEDHASLTNRAFFRSDAHLRLTAGYVIDFVFLVRFLWINGSGGQDVNSSAHCRNAE